VGVHESVQIEDIQHFLVGFLLASEGGVSLLPQELAGAQERRRLLKFPALYKRKT